MMKLLVLLQIAAAAKYDDLRATPRDHRDQRGSVTMEHVIWAVAIITIAGVVILGITNYVTSESAKLK